MVLVCHEANDIFLELAKMARYAQAPEPVTTSVFVGEAVVDSPGVGWPSARLREAASMRARNAAERLDQPAALRQRMLHGVRTGLFHRIEHGDVLTTGCFPACPAAVFMLSWFGTRIYAFGFHVLRSTLFESYKHAASLGAHIEPHCSILNGFLLFLFALHVYWSYLIVRIAVRQLIHGDAEDIRETDHPETKGPQAAAPQAGAPKGGVHEQVRRPVGPRALNPASVGSVGEMPSQM